MENDGIYEIVIEYGLGEKKLNQNYLRGYIQLFSVFIYLRGYI